MSRVSDERLEFLANAEHTMVGRTLASVARELRAQRKVAAAARELRDWHVTIHPVTTGRVGSNVTDALAELDALEDGE